MNTSWNWNEQVFQNLLLVVFTSTPKFPLGFFSPLQHALQFPISPWMFLTTRFSVLCCGCAEYLSGSQQAMEEMDNKPYQPLSKGRHEMEMSYTSSSDESEDGRAHHRSYTSRETLPDYTHELRLTLGSHRERQNNYSQPQAGTTLGARLA